MSPDEQRIAIAEVCNIKINGELYPWPDCIEESRLAHIPDYLNDLNAMHEAEKFIPKESLNGYHYNLSGIVSNWKGSVKESIYKSIFATASQRAEAFLKTIGKWKEPTARTEGEGIL